MIQCWLRFSTSSSFSWLRSFRARNWAFTNIYCPQSLCAILSCLLLMESLRRYSCISLPQILFLLREHSLSAIRLPSLHTRCLSNQVGWVNSIILHFPFIQGSNYLLLFTVHASLLHNEHTFPVSLLEHQEVRPLRKLELNSIPSRPERIHLFTSKPFIFLLITVGAGAIGFWLAQLFTSRAISSHSDCISTK